MKPFGKNELHIKLAYYSQYIWFFFVNGCMPAMIINASSRKGLIYIITMSAIYIYVLMAVWYMF
jgi:hypothetical protein